MQGKYRESISASSSAVVAISSYCAPFSPTAAVCSVCHICIHGRRAVFNIEHCIFIIRIKWPIAEYASVDCQHGAWSYSSTDTRDQCLRKAPCRDPPELVAAVCVYSRPIGQLSGRHGDCHLPNVHYKPRDNSCGHYKHSQSDRVQHWNIERKCQQHVVQSPSQRVGR